MNRLDNMTLNDIVKPIVNELGLFEDAYSHQFESELQYLKPVLDYVGQEKGKRLRPIVFFMSQGLIRPPDPKSVDVAVLFELLHTATLLHDDVVDESTERRGKKALHVMWGNQASVLVGDLLFAKVLNLGVDVPWRDVLKTIAHIVKEMGQSEIQQALISPSDVGVDEYFQTIQGKTAGFFGACSRLGGTIAQATSNEIERLDRLGVTFGMAFQIRDDILDFSGHTDKLGKPVGQDISNGKITLPLILAVENGTSAEKRTVFEKLASSTESDVLWIKEFVDEKEGIQKAQAKAESFSGEATELLKGFNESVYRNSFHDLIHHDLMRMR